MVAPTRRPRLAAAARKLAVAMEAQHADEADRIGQGVRAVAKEIAAEAIPGSLYWQAPFQYVVEQMAPRVAKTHELPMDDATLQRIGTYLFAGFNDYLVAMVGDFDRLHFEAWTAAMIAAEQDRSTTTE